MRFVKYFLLTSCVLGVVQVGASDSYQVPKSTNPDGVGAIETLGFMGSARGIVYNVPRKYMSKTGGLSIVSDSFLEQKEKEVNQKLALLPAKDRMRLEQETKQLAAPIKDAMREEAKTQMESDFASSYPTTYRHYKNIQRLLEEHRRSPKTYRNQKVPSLEAKLHAFRVYMGEAGFTKGLENALQGVQLGILEESLKKYHG